MTIGNRYLNHDNLHCKPICARLGRAVLWTTTSLQGNASTTEWHGHVVRVLSKAVLLLGALVIVPLALIEAVSLFVIAGLGLTINKFLCNNRSEFFQKYSLKALSYAIHSSTLTVALFILGLKNPDLRFHTANAVVDNAIHLASAGFTQSVVGSILDKAAGRDPRLAIVRSINLISDSHPALLNDLVSQIQRDFALNLRDRMGQIPHLEEYLNRHPEDREFVRDFNFRNILQDRAYRQRTGEFVHRFLTDMRLINPAANQAEALRFELNQNTVEEAAYQNRLVRHLKDSFLEIHRTPALSRCLDKAPDQGKDLLEIMDAATYVPLTTYTQYKELLEPIGCPNQFTGNLTRYNQRREKLIAAQQLVNALSAEQRANLVEKILRGSDFQAVGPVQQAYLSIAALAPALYQGPMMTKAAIDLRAVDGANVMDVRNLFQRACQDAIAEINLPQPAIAV